MATCVHASPCRPFFHVSNTSQSHQQPRMPRVLPVGVKCFPTMCVKLASMCPQYGLVLKHRQHETATKYQQGTPVCLLGGKDKSERDNEGSSWNPFEKFMGSFKGKSVEDVLRQQIEKQEFYDGGSGKNPPRGGGGGGDGFEGSDDEGFAGIMDETLQVVLATVGFIFLYVYIISGEELTRLVKDYIKFLLRGSKSVRLKRVMYKWKRFYQRLTEKKEVDKLWLERAIINTPTMYDSPTKYRQILRSMLASNEDE
ncbi:hypothetical protein P3X46_010199 [Hevea brasiliensis]|uniref:Uncharacterized protein n=1 Tax=Hevea brasiliensis TaxID=3981 RepID=A0ABQ9MFD3_HEVBR|nr:uncharacterized protein LOC110661529 isoform X2 [Hevea brasiliensis]KAJ9178305.1 hypothetical protein P3X46_010199 [Hevea brasiliensis]